MFKNWNHYSCVHLFQFEQLWESVTKHEYDDHVSTGLDLVEFFFTFGLRYPSAPACDKILSHVPDLLHLC